MSKATRFLSPKFLKYLKAITSQGEESATAAREIITEPHSIFSVEKGLNPPEDIMPKLSQDEVMEVLRDAEAYPIPVEGKYGSKENSIFVPDPSKEVSEFIDEMARSTGQESILNSTGKQHQLQYVTGPKKGMHNPGEGSVIHPSEPEDYYSKLGQTYFTHNIDFDKIKNVLAGGSALGAAALGGEDSEAAGIQTIMKKLGVGLEEAKRLKQLATEVAPTGLHDENIRAVQDVSRLFKEPHLFKKLGNGMDYVAHQSPSGRVVKEPMSNQYRRSRKDDIDDVVSPALMDYIQRGVNTKTVKVGESPYQVQDLVTPLDKISKKASRRGGDPELERLYKGIDAQYDNYNGPAIKKSEKAINKRRVQLFKNEGIDAAKLRKQYRELDKQEQAHLAHPEEGTGIQTGKEINTPWNIEKAFRMLFEQDTQRELGDVIRAYDLHEGNIGLNSKRKPVAFDTSRFQNFQPDQLDDGMKDQIRKSFIAKPEERTALEEAISGVQTTRDGGKYRPIGTSEMPSTGWKTGAAAGALGAMAASNDAEASPMDSKIFKKLSQLVGGKSDDGVRMSEKAKTLNERLIGMNENNQWYKPSGKNVKGWAPEEAQMTLETLPVEVQNAIAEAAKGDNQVMDAIYSKYFDYGSKPNDLNKLLPEQLPEYTHGKGSYQDMLKSRLKRGAPAVAGAVGAGLGGVSYLPEAEASPKLENPVDYYQKFNSLRKKLVGDTVDHVIEQSTPADMHAQAKEYNEPTKFGLEMATDPLNAVEGPMGLIAPFFLDSEEEP